MHHASYQKKIPRNTEHKIIIIIKQSKNTQFKETEKAPDIDTLVMLEVSNRKLKTITINMQVVLLDKVDIIKNTAQRLEF